jgi:hypothetical protein
MRATSRIFLCDVTIKIRSRRFLRIGIFCVTFCCYIEATLQRIFGTRFGTHLKLHDVALILPAWSERIGMLLAHLTISIHLHSDASSTNNISST